MENMSWGDLLLAASTLIGGVIAGGFIRQKENDKQLKSFSNVEIRQQAVNRKWEGKYKSIDYLDIVQESIKTEEIQISVDLNSTGKIVEGKATYNYNGVNGATTLILRGGFRSESELYLDYENENKRVINYGHMLLKLNGNASRLTGYILGRGRDPDCPFVAKIELH